MILREEVINIGRTQKPHGLKGEISADIEAECELQSGHCIVFDIDGILVPFYIENSRRKNAESILLKLEGIDDEKAAAELSLKDIFILSDAAEECGLAADDDDSILYLSDMPGYMVVDTEGRVIGTILRIDDTTINTLLEVEAPNGKKMLIPFSEDFVSDVDPVNKSIMLDLPQGILDLNQ